MRKILLLFTGGTIASIKTERGLEPVLNAEQIMSYLPEISEDIHLGSRQICNLDSTDIEYHHWLEMARQSKRIMKDMTGMSFAMERIQWPIQQRHCPILFRIL